jgi:hypothetical protein
MMIVFSHATFSIFKYGPRRSPERRMPFWPALIAVLLVGTATALAGNPPAASPDYVMLLDFIRMEDRKEPLVEFRQTGQEIDADLSRENRHYISGNEALLGKIRTELNSEELHWRLVDATQHLMVVPENQGAYAALFENYCRSVVGYVLQETALSNPYRTIATLEGPLASQEQTHEEGITAYLVHNIADVYTEEYAFFDAANTDRSVRIKLDNRVYLGEIGSYSSYLVINEGPLYSFEHNPYTLWRNSAANPLNVFIAPIEETLHIALRHTTEDAIKNRLSRRPPDSRADIEAVVEEWMAVEEAAVGGLVSALLPGVLDRFLEGDAAVDIARAFAERRQFEKYRFLDRGIALVDELGLSSAIRIYRENPGQFKSLLMPQPPALPENAGDEAAEASPGESGDSDHRPT